MASRKYVLIICLLWGYYCQAQQLLLTQAGLTSSEDPSKTYVEYAYRDCDFEQMKSYLNKRLESVSFFKYNIKYLDDHTITISGLMDSNSFLVFGTKEIAFNLQLELKESSVKVEMKLTKNNGKALNYGILFSKSGKVRFVPAKNKIEEEVRGLIEQIFETKIIIT